MPNELDRLGARWQKELRLRFVGNPQVAQLHAGRARLLVGQMEQGRRFIENGSSQLRKVYGDGIVINAQYNGTAYIAEIDVTGVAPPPQEPIGDIWFPQGIVFVPANDDAPKGWGIPVIPDDDVNVLNPGPKIDPWTPDGALPQVLLSRAKNAGYPQTKRSTPLYYDTFEKPALKPVVPKQDGKWAVYRARFRDLGAGFMAVLQEINNRRDGDQPLCPPLFGFADLADVYRNLVSKLGFDETGYPIGSDSIFKRIEKEGDVRIAAEDSARGILGTGSVSQGDTVSQIVDALEGAIPSLTDDTLKAGSSFSMVGNGQVFLALLDHTDQWIKVGNVDWKSIHDEIPGLSWSGPPGRSIPPDEMAIAHRRDPGLGTPCYIDAMTYDWHGQKIKLFDQYVYCRGRILAMLPEDGYVLGAGIQKVTGEPNEPPKYRLLVIAWHKVDQHYQGQAGYVIHFDSTSDIRTWYVDLPTRNGLTCNPPYVVEKAYDVDTNPYGWQQIDRHRLWSLPNNTTGGSDNNYGPGNGVPSSDDAGNYASENDRLSEKAYWQPWFFNGSATEAVCLRADIAPSLLDFSAGCSQVARAIKCFIDDTPSSSIQSAWNSYGAPQNTGNPFAFSYIAWDYDGDDEKRVFVSGGAGGEASNGFIASDDGTTYINDLNWLSTDSFADGLLFPSLWHVDARSNTFIRADSLVQIDAAPGATRYPRNIRIAIVANGTQEESYSFNIASNTQNTYSSFNPFFIGGYQRELLFPAVGNDGAGHPYMMLGMAEIDGDYACGIWYGAGPSTWNGSSYNVGYITASGAINSSIDLPTLMPIDDGWFNFAGVIR